MKYTAVRVQKRDDRGGYFEAVLSYKENGRFREKRKKLKAKTKKNANFEAENWRQAEETKARTVAVEELKAPRFIEYLEDEIQYKTDMKQVSAARVHDYHKSLNDLKANFPNKPINEYSRKDIENFYRKEQKKGVSNYTLRRLHYILKMAFDKAGKEGLLDNSPLSYVDIPKPQKMKPGINSLDVEGMKDFIATLSHLEPSAVRMGAFLALYTGMRRGEVCALRWRDVDLRRKVLYVKQAVGISYDNATYELKDPKTHKTRDIAIPDALIKELQEWQTINGTEEFVIGHDGTFTHPEYLGHRYMALVKLLGIKGIEGRPLTFHDLRHTYATLTIAEGADVVSVAAQLGHADVSMTLNTYAGVLPHAKKQVASIMDDLAE